MRSFEEMSDEKLMPDSFSHRTMSNLILWPHVLFAVETCDRELKSAQKNSGTSSPFELATLAKSGMCIQSAKSPIGTRVRFTGG